MWRLISLLSTFLSGHFLLNLHKQAETYLCGSWQNSSYTGPSCQIIPAWSIIHFPQHFEVQGTHTTLTGKDCLPDSDIRTCPILYFPAPLANCEAQLPAKWTLTPLKASLSYPKEPVTAQSVQVVLDLKNVNFDVNVFAWHQVINGMQRTCWYILPLKTAKIWHSSPCPNLGLLNIWNSLQSTVLEEASFLTASLAIFLQLIQGTIHSTLKMCIKLYFNPKFSVKLISLLQSIIWLDFFPLIHCKHSKLGQNNSHILVPARWFRNFETNG